ncbi:hypothetical protein [Piscinibacter sp.]|jgi:hypothetical protein|uniref:hypothetical protein n=1 Tax=Piscinibacter sp. TaxID=1903157 RepID=UPI00355A352E
MLRGTHTVRLTGREVQRLTQITGFEPIDVRTLDDLERYVRACKRHYWGVSDATRYLHWLIDREVAGCVSQPMDRGGQS